MGASGARQAADYIPIAEVDRARGLQGEVVVTVHADDPGRMARLEQVFLREGDDYLPIAVLGVKRLGERAVLRLAGYDSVERARELVGRELFIPPEASTPAPAGRYYAYQLTGLAVRLADGRPLGKVRGVLEQGPVSLLMVELEGGEEVLVPLVRAICTEIDVEGGTVTVDPPEGLIDLNRPDAAKG